MATMSRFELTIAGLVFVVGPIVVASLFYWQLAVEGPRVRALCQSRGMQTVELSGRSFARLCVDPVTMQVYFP